MQFGGVLVAQVGEPEGLHGMLHWDWFGGKLGLLAEQHARVASFAFSLELATSAGFMVVVTLVVHPGSDSFIMLLHTDGETSERPI